MKNGLKIFAACILSVLFVKGQDVHFSQYYFSPLSINPANTGNYRGDYRFFGNYRSQWREISRPYNTFSVGGDFNIYPSNQQVSGGLIFINDKSGGNLNVNKILPSAAIHRKAGGFNLHAGLQPGVVIKSIDFYAHSFPNQLNWGSGKFDSNLPNYETNVNQRFTYFDLNLGAGVSRKFDKWEPEIGFALFHVNRPKESFLTNNTKLPLRQAYTLGLNYYLNDQFILKAHSMYGYTTKVSDWVSGINVEYVLSKNVFFTNSIFAGFMWRDGFNRNSDAAIATIGMNYSHYTVGLSYDITFSQLKTAVESRGAFELALIYRAKSTRLTTKAIPCERY